MEWGKDVLWIRERRNSAWDDLPGPFEQRWLCVTKGSGECALRDPSDQDFPSQPVLPPISGHQDWQSPWRSAAHTLGFSFLNRGRN